MNESIEQVKTRVKYKTSLMVLVIAFLVLVTATLAWFTLSGMAGVNTLDMSVTTGTDLSISIDGNTWSKTLTAQQINAYMNASNGYKSTMEDMNLQPVSNWNDTSAATLRFEDNTEVSVESAKENGVYLYIPVWLKSTSNCNVFLSAARFNDSASSTLLQNGTEITADTTKNNGNAALNQIYKAVRFSITPNNATAAAIVYEQESDSLQGGVNPAKLVNHSSLGTVSGSNNPAAARVAVLNADQAQQFWLKVWVEGNSSSCTDSVKGASFKVAIAFDSEEIGA